MKRQLLLPAFLLAMATGLPAAAVAAEATAPHGLAARLHELAISAGRWIYHGHFIGAAGASGSAWTWHEACRWSENRVFMLCSFSNTWAGRHVDSVVVDTYDRHDHSFWHYEIFDGGDSAGKPFAARMRIEGATRIESWSGKHGGRPVDERIVYRFASDTRVTVRFEESTDGIHWRTTASGTGEKVASR